jgi:2-polyprenyl-3-methyl-5-hydroxy-6-metoxy-1,4-benzoquinol methylase
MKSEQGKNQKQRNFYNSSNPSYLEHEKNIPYARHIVRRLLTAFSRPEIMSVLEVGAGQGRFTLELARHVAHLTATDLSRKQIDILKEKLHSPMAPKNRIGGRMVGKTDVTCHTHDLLSAAPQALKGKTYDAVVGFFMLHHIDRTLYPSVISNLLPLLSDSGRMVFIEPNNLYPFHLVEMMIEPDMEWEIEKQIYSPYISTFVQAAEHLGLHKVMIERFGFFPPPFINILPQITTYEPWIERLPVIHQFFTPFVFMHFKREG